ncbi:hypothetical protein QFC22_002982 [Naganishia vaughanmartiniae]|uniref:Uncharacterized protein n=1 Tax=Naganishia vaughanmartiniae TaxID=1424756 RepID=A0ACC2X7P9_9TREE|nr:hypothetical protein QFC22_002982 [Naganishia vaughanmartiniae]
MFLTDDTFSDHSSFDEYISVSPSLPSTAAMDSSEATRQFAQYPTQTSGEVVDGMNKTMEELSNNLYSLSVPLQSQSILQSSLPSSVEGLSQCDYSNGGTLIEMPPPQQPYPYNTSMNYQAQMTPMFFDPFGRPQQQQMNGIFFQNQYCFDAANQQYQGQNMNMLSGQTISAPNQIISTQPQPFNPRFQSGMFDQNMQLSVSAPSRIPMYTEQFPQMLAMPTPQTLDISAHPGFFRVNSAAPLSTNLEPASGPQRSNSARPILQTAPLRRKPSTLKDESCSSQLPAVKPKANGVAFPAYVDRVEIPAEWKEIYASDKELPTGFSRPPYDYAGLIGRVLLEDSDAPKRMTVAELFYALINKYPFYMANPRLLYNGLRHNLTGCEALIKADRQWGDQASSRYWTIKPGSESCFRTGYFVKDSKKGSGRSRKMVPFVEASVIHSLPILPAPTLESGSIGNQRTSFQSTVKAQSVSSRKPSGKNGRTFSGICFGSNALALTGLEPSNGSPRKPLSTKTNANNRKAKGGVSQSATIDVEEYSKKQENIKERNAKKIAAVDTQAMRPYPYHTTTPAVHGGLMFQPPGANTGPYMTTMPAVPQYVPEVQTPLVQAKLVDSYSPLGDAPDTHDELIQSNANAIAATELYISKLNNTSGVENRISVAESNSGGSAISSPSDSCLASAMDFTLVRRRSQEELDAGMQG